MNEKQDLVCVFKGQAFEAEVVRARLESDGISAMGSSFLRVGTASKFIK